MRFLNFFSKKWIFKIFGAFKASQSTGCWCKDHVSYMRIKCYISAFFCTKNCLKIFKTRFCSLIWKSGRKSIFDQKNLFLKKIEIFQFFSKKLRFFWKFCSIFSNHKTLSRGRMKILKLWLCRSWRTLGIAKIVKTWKW